MSDVGSTNDINAPASSPKQSPNAAVRFFKKFLILCIVLAFAALVFIFLSDRNTRRYKLQRDEDGKLYVLKGMKLPAGFERWHPDDQELAETYAPFVLSEEVLAGLYSDTVYEERDELDRALFNLHQDSIEMLSGRDDSKSIEQVVRLLGRASRLGGVTAAQRAKLKALTAKSSFFEGRLRLQEAASLLQTSTAKFRLAMESEESGYSDRAGQILDDIKASAAVIVKAARKYQSSSTVESDIRAEKKNKEETASDAPGNLPVAAPAPEKAVSQPSSLSGSSAASRQNGDLSAKDPAAGSDAASKNNEERNDGAAADSASAGSGESSGENSKEDAAGEAQDQPQEPAEAEASGENQ